MGVIRIIFLFLSMFGFSLFFSKKYQMDISCSLAIGTAWVIVVEYIAAFLGILQYTSWLIAFCGLVCFIYMVIKDYHFCMAIFRLSSVLFVGSCIVSVYVLFGKQLAFVDDFNHWGTIARFIAENHRLPAAQDTLIRYTSYPPGSALWIYYCTEIIGNKSEYCFLISQAILIAILLFPFFHVLVDNHKTNSHILQWMYFGVASIVLFTIMVSSQTILSLFVDGLLSASAIAVFSIIWVNRNSINNRLCLYIALIVLPAIIKQAGILFSLSGIVFVIYVCKSKSFKKWKSQSIVFVLCAIALVLLWQIHVNTTFANTISPHAISISRYNQVFSGYNMDEIKKIISMFVSAVLSYKTLGIPGGITLVLFVVYILYRKQDNFIMQRMPAFWLYLIIHYILFLFGLAFVYIFSMERSGALRLSSYGRYLFPIHIFSIAVTAVYLQEQTKESVGSGKFQRPSSGQRRTKKVIPLFCATSLCLLTILCANQSIYLSINYNKNYTEENAIRKHTLELLQGNSYDDIAVYADSILDGYYNNAFIKSEIRYDAQTSNVDLVSLDDEKHFYETLRSHSYIMIWHKDEKMEEFLNGKGLKMDDGIYPIDIFIQQ